MSTLLITHPDCLEHDPGPGHPERPDRLRAIWDALDAPEFAALIRRQAIPATREQLELVHPAGYVDHILRPAPETGWRKLDAETWLSAGTARAALLSAGGAVQSVDAVIAGEVANAFVALRPPGHHAEKALAMGFCYFANAAIAAVHAQREHGLDRVAVVDFDVHHGNGTQQIFWDRPGLFYASSHQWPLFPGTGDLDERGLHDNIRNAPLPAEIGPAGFRQAWAKGLLPWLESVRPQLIVVSAGFDAHVLDPLGALEIREEDFAWLTQELAGVAGRHAKGRLVSLLEGGYDLTGLAGSVAAHVAELMLAGEAP